MKQDLGCACKDPKYRIREGDDIFGSYLDTKLFQLQLWNCRPKTPVMITITMSDIKKVSLLWILLGGSNRESHVSSSS